MDPIVHTFALEVLLLLPLIEIVNNDDILNTQVD